MSGALPMAHGGILEVRIMLRVQVSGAGTGGRPHR